MAKKKTKKNNKEEKIDQRKKSQIFVNIAY